MEGSHHDFPSIADWWLSFLSDLGYSAELLTWPNVLGTSAEIVILGGLRYRETPGYEPLRLRELQSLRKLKSDRALLAFHSVIGSWDECAELDEVWDGRWRWNASSHSPISPFRVSVARAHRVVENLANFTTTDELYYRLRGPIASEVLLEAEYEGMKWPLAWCQPGYVYCGLGHDLYSLETPSVKQFLSESLSWINSSAKQTLLSK